MENPRGITPDNHLLVGIQSDCRYTNDEFELNEFEQPT